MARLMFGAVAAIALVAAVALTVVGRDARISEAGIPPHLSLSPLMETEPVGAEVEFDITIEYVFNFGAYKIDIAYDPDVLEFQAFTSGPFLQSTKRVETCQDPSFPAPGIVQLGCTTIQPPGPLGIEVSGVEPGPNGDGTLGQIEFRGLCAAESSITFSNVSLSTTIGAPIEPVTRSAGSTAMITGMPSCSATPTSTPLPPTSTPPPTDEPIETPPPATPTPDGPTATSAPPTPTLAKACGDANSDGSVDSIDALVILQKVAGLLTDVPNPNAADVNADGAADALDSLLVLQHIVGLLQVLAC